MTTRIEFEVQGLDILELRLRAVQTLKDLLGVDVGLAGFDMSLRPLIGAMDSTGPIFYWTADVNCVLP